MIVATEFTRGQAVVIVRQPTWGRDRAPTLSPDAIDKIGRRWVTLASGRRFDPETRELDAGEYESDETVWPSAEVFARHAQRRAHWAVVRASARGEDPPEALDDDTLAKVVLALGAGEGRGS